jgi:hypothetical protein
MHFGWNVAPPGGCGTPRVGELYLMTDYPPLALHVPEPAVRPGGTPDFSNVPIPEAGSVERPEVDADPETIRGFLTGMGRR